MKKSKTFPKAWALGQRNTERIWEGDVEITEKIDGSQIGFGIVDGELIIRSKNQEIHDEGGMFNHAVTYIRSIEDRLLPGFFYYGEYLRAPKHNTLEYASIPKNHIALFGIKRPDGSYIAGYKTLHGVAKQLNIDVVPLLYYGPVDSPEFLLQFMEEESILGGQSIEGVVIKNYTKDIVIGGDWYPFVQGKHVSERFKEKHVKGWKKQTSPGKFDELKQMYRTEARWEKAIQYLRDMELLTESPKDIGGLIKYINHDITAEEKENIKDQLWVIYHKEILRAATAGLPEWYKERLLNASFESCEHKHRMMNSGGVCCSDCGKQLFDEEIEDE